MIKIGDRVFYFESSAVNGFGLVIEIIQSQEKSKKYYISANETKPKIFVLLKDKDGQLEEFLEFDLKKVSEM
jgi:hypothetical protein